MNFGRFLAALPVAGALLAGCGGSGTNTAATAGTNPVLAGQAGQAGGTGSTGNTGGNGIAVGEPNPSALSILPFTKMARSAACAETRNRLFVIDGKQVFWDHAGHCADASYEQVLFGNKPETTLCRHGDTIAGPRTSCQDESAKALFDTAVANLEQPDLGLGKDHTVERVPFLPQAGTEVVFTSIASNNISGVTTPKNVVIRDQAAWEKLWAEHGAFQQPAPALPKVDFTRQMLIAVFSGDYHDACYGLSVAAIHAGEDELVVDVNERRPRMGVMCAQIATNPMQVVAVDRIDADVDFVVASTVDVAFEVLANSSNSQAIEEQNVVAKDADAYARLWAQFNSGTAAPQVDFANNMVIGVFMGPRNNGCHATSVGGIARTDKELRVQRVDLAAPDGVLCLQATTSPAQLVVTARSDLPVVVSASTQTAQRPQPPQQ